MRTVRSIALGKRQAVDRPQTGADRSGGTLQHTRQACRQAEQLTIMAGEAQRETTAVDFIEMTGPVNASAPQRPANSRQAAPRMAATRRERRQISSEV
eukprot:scaffold6127_cov159-Isochrysis_galbana.AAC.1